MNGVCLFYNKEVTTTITLNHVYGQNKIAIATYQIHNCGEKNNCQQNICKQINHNGKANFLRVIQWQNKLIYASVLELVYITV